MSKNTIRYANWIFAFLLMVLVFAGKNVLPFIATVSALYVVLGVIYVIHTRAYKNLSFRKRRKETPYKVFLGRSDKRKSQSSEHTEDFMFDGGDSEEDYATVDFGDEDDYEYEELEEIPDEALEGTPDSPEGDSSESGSESEFDKKYRLAKVEKVLSQVDRIPKMGGLEFESFLRDLYDALGYEVQMTDINDQGADLLVRHGNEKIVIQAKRYKNAVSNSAVQQVFTAKHFYGCDRAIVITNSTFTKSAREVAEKVGVELWDKDSLKSMLMSMKTILNG